MKIVPIASLKGGNYFLYKGNHYLMNDDYQPNILYTATRLKDGVMITLLYDTLVEEQSCILNFYEKNA